MALKINCKFKYFTNFVCVLIGFINIHYNPYCDNNPSNIIKNHTIMKTRLIWEESWMNNNKNSFWIECTDKEVIDHILSLKSDSLFLEEIKRNRGYSQIDKNINENIFCNFFLISDDLEDIKSFTWVYPYSGMWNAGNPFRTIELIDFDNLNCIKGSFDTVKRIKF